MDLQHTNSWSLLKFMSIQPSHPLLSPSAFNLSQRHGLFQWVSSLHQAAKYWSFSISPSNEYSGLMSFTTDWFYILAVWGTLKNLLQHHNLKALFLRCWAFLMVQLSHLHMTTGKTIALTTWTFVGKVFLPRSKSLLIWWLQSPSAVILEPKKIKSVTVSTVSLWSPRKWSLLPFPLFPHLLPWSDGAGCHDLSFLNVEL